MVYAWNSQYENFVQHLPNNAISVNINKTKYKDILCSQETLFTINTLIFGNLKSGYSTVAMRKLTNLAWYRRIRPIQAPLCFHNNPTTRSIPCQLLLDPKNESPAKGLQDAVSKRD
jgi:hypothetical protein